MFYIDSGWIMILLYISIVMQVTKLEQRHGLPVGENLSEPPDRTKINEGRNLQLHQPWFTGNDFIARAINLSYAHASEGPRWEKPHAR